MLLTMLETIVYCLFKAAILLKHWRNVCLRKSREITTTRHGQIKMKVKKSNNSHCLIAGAHIEISAFDLNRYTGIDSDAGWNGVAVGHLLEDGWLQIEPQLDVDHPPDHHMNHVNFKGFDFDDLMPYEEETELAPLHAQDRQADVRSEFSGHSLEIDSPEDEDGDESTSNEENNKNKKRNAGCVDVAGVVHDNV